MAGDYLKDTIYREDAINATRSLTPIIGGGYISKSEMQWKLMELPSAEPDIIRCKDCKYYYNTSPENIPTANIICFQMHEDDYCSYAERRADDGRKMDDIR